MVKRKLTKKTKARKGKKRGGAFHNPFNTPFFTVPTDAIRDWGNSVPGTMTNFGEDIGKAFKGRGKKHKSKKGKKCGGVTPKMKANKFRQEIVKTFKGKGNTRGGRIFPGTHQGDWDIDYRNAINRGYSPEQATSAANAFNGPR